jgi:hypothetical protein
MLLLLFLEIPGYVYESTQNNDNNNKAKKSIILMIIKIINQVLMKKNVLWFYTHIQEFLKIIIIAFQNISFPFIIRKLKLLYLYSTLVNKTHHCRTVK